MLGQMDIGSDGLSVAMFIAIIIAIPVCLIVFSPLGPLCGRYWIPSFARSCNVAVIVGTADTACTD